MRMVMKIMVIIMMVMVIMALITPWGEDGDDKEHIHEKGHGDHGDGDGDHDPGDYKIIKTYLEEWCEDIRNIIEGNHQRFSTPINTFS